MKTHRVSGLDIQVPTNKAFAYETGKELPKLHQNCLIVGARGSGKTVAAVNLLRMLPFDRIFCISPTVKSNHELMKKLNIDPMDVHENPDDLTCLAKIREAVEKEAADLDKYEEDLRKYDKLMKTLNSTSPLFQVSDEDLESFFKDGDFKKPEHKWGGRKPICALLCDDCMGSQLFTKGIRQLNQLCIFHRHVGQLKKGGSIGISLFFLLQSYLAQAGGISKCIRNNATSLIVFSSKSEKQLDEIASECSGEVSKEMFMQVYNHAIQQKHDFLFKNFFKKDSHPSMFRRNFSEYIVTDDD